MTKRIDVAIASDAGYLANKIRLALFPFTYNARPDNDVAELIEIRRKLFDLERETAFLGGRLDAWIRIARNGGRP